jgi:hypothetical protein
MVNMLRFGRVVFGCTLSLLLCQCETQRTVKSTRTSYDFKGKSADGTADDSQAIRSKFAERGFTIGEDGSIIADRPDLYGGAKARGLDKQIEQQESRFANKTAATKEFPVPEYIKRQDYRGVSEARESSTLAREGNFASQRNQADGQLFSTKSEDSSSLNLFKTSAATDSSRAFATKSDRSGERAFNQPAVAVGTTQAAGYKDNAAMTIDDVKKLLSPESVPPASSTR